MRPILAGGLLAMVDALVPRRVGLEAGAGDPVRVLDDEPIGRPRHAQAVAGMPLTVDVSPGAQRLEDHVHRTAGEQGMGDRDRRFAVRHADASLQHHITHAPLPARQPVGHREAGQQLMSVRVDDS